MGAIWFYSKNNCSSSIFPSFFLSPVPILKEERESSPQGPEKSLLGLRRSTRGQSLGSPLVVGWMMGSTTTWAAVVRAVMTVRRS